MNNNRRIAKDDEARNDKTKYKKRSRKGSNQKRSSKSYQDEGKGTTAGIKRFDATAKDSNGDVNDPAYYMLDPQIAEQVTQLSFNRIANGPTSLIGTFKPALFTTFTMNPSPGTKRNITYAPVAESMYEPYSGFNLCMKKLYQIISAQTGRVTSYTPHDIGMAILSIGEILSITEYLRRFFGLAYTYNERNWFYPLAAMKSMGLDADTFVKNIAVHRTRLNNIITQINSLPILGDIAYLKKCVTLYQNVYLDEDNPLANSFAYVPGTTWILDETSYELGSALITQPWCTDLDGSWVGVRTMDSMLDKLSEIVDALFTSTTLTVVWADIINYAAKTGRQLFKLDYIREDYIVVPFYNREASLMMHNMVIMSSPSAFTARDPEAHPYFTPYNDVMPAANVTETLYDPVFSKNYSQAFNRCLMDVDTPNPTTYDRMEFSRYMILWSGVNAWIDDPDNIIGRVGMILPDHYVTGAFFFKDQALSPSMSRTYSIAGVVGGSVEATYNLVSAFDVLTWAPIIYVLNNSATDNIASGTHNIVGDLHYYTAVDPLWLSAVNNNYFLALFSIR